MSILPCTILKKIFCDLGGKELSACRKVCQLWRNVVDNMVDEDLWHEFCARNYCEVFKDAFKKSKLTSWRDLHESLSLWDQVSFAEVRIRPIPATSAYKFELLQNGVVAFPQESDRKPDCLSVRNVYHQIVYFDLGCFLECHRECFHFKFAWYHENDDLIAVQQDGVSFDGISLLHVIAKVNKDYVFTKNITQIIVHGTKVYYVKYCDCDTDEYDEALFVTELLEVKNHIDFKTDMIVNTAIAEPIKDVVALCDNRHNILTNNFAILSARDLRLEVLYCHVLTRPDKFGLAKFYGFNQTDVVNGLLLKERDLFGTARGYVHGKIVIVGKVEPPTIHIFCNPYTPCGEIDLRYRIPNRSIDLRPCGISTQKINSYPQPMQQIGAVETLNGHKILVLFCETLFVIELKHKAN